MLRRVRDRDAALEGRRILVVEDDARNIFALERAGARGATVEIARNGREALEVAGPRPLRLGAWRARPRADGHHDAGDGRPHGDARDPQARRA